MGCCGNQNPEGHNNHEGNNHGGHGNQAHKWMMMLCMLPIVLVAVLLLTKSISLSAGNSWLLLLILLCPLSHFILMPFMARKKKNH